MITLLLILTLSFSQNSSGNRIVFQSLLIIVVFGTLLTRLLTSKNVKEYKKIYKQNITLAVFENIFTDIKFIPDKGLSKYVIAETDMMNTGDRYFSNDYIRAKYKGINFEGSDVEIQVEYRDSDGDRSYTTIFKGQWFIFDFNKNFKANIQVCEKSFSGAKRGSWFSEKTYNEVKMEDVDFNKKFDIYAENEFDAFYVLTPNTIQKIQELNKKIKGNLLFCFINNKLHIGIHNRKDLFEPNVYKNVNLEKDKEKILEEIKIITEFVDILDLDNDLFKRSL